MSSSRTYTFVLGAGPPIVRKVPAVCKCNVFTMVTYTDGSVIDANERKTDVRATYLRGTATVVIVCGLCPLLRECCDEGGERGGKTCAVQRTYEVDRALRPLRPP